MYGMSWKAAGDYNTAQQSNDLSKANSYLMSNPDVMQAYLANPMGASTPQEFAYAHYDKFGQNEGRTFGGSTTQNLGMGGTAPASSGNKNPYLDEMAQGITDQMNQNWSRNLAPSIRSGAMAAGGFGGSRQGVVEANGLNDLNRTLGQSLTSLYGQDWTNQQNRNLQQQQINNQDKQYYSGLDSNNAQFGANLGLNTMNAQNQWALNGVNAANQMQQTPINYFNTFNQNANQIAGQGGSTSQTNQGNPWVTALGGAQLANQFYKG
jgi:hypothetical protein